MANDAGGHDAGSTGGRGMPWRMLGWGMAALLLLLPLIAKAPWTAFDFGMAAILIGGLGLCIELVAARSASPAYRLGAAVGLAAAMMILWTNGAVGIIGAEDDTHSLLFAGVIAVALTGAIVARFSAAGMARAMIAAAFAQLAVSAAGLTIDLAGALLGMAMAAPWVLSALSFRKAARDEAEVTNTA